MTDPTPFELTGALPTGTTVLEASAGTGKTYAIAALATRYVAEAGVPLGELLLVTFTRAAAAELRERVRRRLVQAADHLEAVLAGGEVAPGDALLDHLADAGPAEQRTRHRRLVDAATEFDTATISTIHGFCQQVLRGIGLAADVPREATLLEDEAELLEQVVGDRMVAKFLDRPGAPALKDVLAAATAAAADPDAVLLPTEPATDDDVAGEDADATSRLIAEVAREARDELIRRKRAAGVLSHHDLLTRLRDAVSDPATGQAAVAVLRDRYRIALIDEFQDTDPVQWEILDRALGSGHDRGRPSAAVDGRRAGTGRSRPPQRALVLIGDPKQAIYAFRGADVRAYLAATEQATARHTLPTNWRCDAPLVDALNRFFGGTVYGEAQITHRDVSAAPGRERSSLRGDPASTAPFALRAVTAVGPNEVAPTSGNTRESLIPADVAAEIGRTLAPGAVTVDGRPAEPGDIAVLVRANKDAAVVQQTLRQSRIPAVINGVGSVLRTPAAEDWRELLDALERPSSVSAARRLAVTAFGGWDGRALAAADDAAWDEIHERLHAWAATLRDRGVAALLRRVSDDTGLAARVLGTVGGERHLTDLHHVGRLLHAAEVDGERGAAALAAWLGERIDAADDGEIAPDEQARRLESDAQAVQILTVHRSKGLEFPIVLCPFLWLAQRPAQAPLTVHDPTGGGRTIDVGPSGRTGFDVARDRWKQEQQAEDLRLLYVAATRARHRVVVWWVVPSRKTPSALATVLYSRDDDGRVTADRQPELPDRDATLAVLAELATSCGGRVDQVPPVIEPPQQTDAPVDVDALRVADHRRRLDRAWRRTSYSGLAAGDDHASLPDEADETTTDDEHLDDRPAPLPDDATDDRGRDLRSLALPLADVRGSAELGTMLHEVMELTDYATPDLDAEVARVLDQQRHRHGITADRDALLAGMLAALRTPLGPLADGRPLTSFTRRDRMDEPRFELPLAGGDRPRGRGPAALAGLADLVAHHLPDDDPLVGYDDLLRDPRFRTDLRGYLNGAIDLVLRVGEGAATRYLVVDHKTNRLGWPDTPTAWHYRPAGLGTAMQDGHYPLQAMIYGVALHRLLRWRLPGYDPDQHLGGVAYLFLRGMTGPDVPHVGGQPCGVFSWRPPTALITDLSDLLDGRGEAAA